MLLSFGYLYKFVMFYFFFFFQKAENNRLRKNPVGQNFVFGVLIICNKKL